MLKNNLFKTLILLFLFSTLGTNIYFYSKKPDLLTQHKKDFSNPKGQSNFTGQLNLWYFFASRNDWHNAANFELDLNQIETFKKNNQPDKLKQRLSELKLQDNKSAQDYLTLAKIQSVLGLNDQAVQSIKEAHQLDPIRSDLDNLFYSIVDL